MLLNSILKGLLFQCTKGGKACITCTILIQGRQSNYLKKKKTVHLQQ